MLQDQDTERRQEKARAEGKRSKWKNITKRERERGFAWFTTECPNINERMAKKRKKKRVKKRKVEASMK